MNNNDTEKIYNDVKRKISISNFIEEEKNDMEKNKYLVFKSIAVACCIFLTITGVAFAKNIGIFISNLFGNNSNEGVQTAVDNGYIKYVEPNYIESNGIGFSVDSFLIDDYNFDMNFKIKLSDKYNVEEMRRLQPFDMKVTDENNEIVFITGELEKLIAEENKTAGTPNYHPLFWGGYSMNGDIISKNEIMLHLTAYGSEEHKIPKSKKLYVTFSKVINKVFIEEEKNKTYIGEWKIELDVPEEMYKRETIIYKVKSCNDDNTKVENATLSNTVFKISISETTTNKVDYDLLKVRPPKNASDLIALGKEYVETSDGKRFEPASKGDGHGGLGLSSEPNKIINYSETFNLTKFDATDELKVHIFTNKGEEIIIEYERSK